MCLLYIHASSKYTKAIIGILYILNILGFTYFEFKAKGII